MMFDVAFHILDRIMRYVIQFSEIDFCPTEPKKRRKQNAARYHACIFISNSFFLLLSAQCVASRKMENLSMWSHDRA